MTPEELLEAQKEQTPLVWSPPPLLLPDHPEIVTLNPQIMQSRRGYVVQIQRASGTNYTTPESLRPATAQDLLEYGDTP